MREAELAEPDRARGKISTVGAFFGAFFLIILRKATLGDSYWLLFESQTTHHSLGSNRSSTPILSRTNIPLVGGVASPPTKPTAVAAVKS